MIQEVKRYYSLKVTSVTCFGYTFPFFWTIPIGILQIPHYFTLQFELDACPGCSNSTSCMFQLPHPSYCFVIICLQSPPLDKKLLESKAVSYLFLFLHFLAQCLAYGSGSVNFFWTSDPAQRSSFTSTKLFWKWYTIFLPRIPFSEAEMSVSSWCYACSNSKDWKLLRSSSLAAPTPDLARRRACFLGWEVYRLMREVDKCHLCEWTMLRRLTELGPESLKGQWPLVIAALGESCLCPVISQGFFLSGSSSAGGSLSSAGAAASGDKATGRSAHSGSAGEGGPSTRESGPWGAAAGCGARPAGPLWTTNGAQVGPIPSSARGRESSARQRVANLSFLPKVNGS